MTGQPKYVLEAQVGHLLRRANQRHTVLFGELFEREGLTTLQFAVLMKLREHGAVSQNRLGRHAAMDPNTIQGVVQRLEKRGLVERRPDPDDRRRKLLDLTAAGTELAASLVAKGHRISALTLAPLSPNERARFLALLGKLV